MYSESSGSQHPRRMYVSVMGQMHDSCQDLSLNLFLLYYLEDGQRKVIGVDYKVMW